MEIVLRAVKVICVTLLGLAAIGTVWNRPREIRTVVYPLKHAHEFDLEVNELISAGWRLKQIVVNREQDLSNGLVAFLEK